MLPPSQHEMNAKYLEHKLEQQEAKLERIRRTNLALAMSVVGFTIAGITLNPWLLLLTLIPLGLIAGHSADAADIEKEIEDTTFYIHKARLRQEEDLNEWAQQMLNEQ